MADVITRAWKALHVLTAFHLSVAEDVDAGPGDGHCTLSRKTLALGYLADRSLRDLPPEPPTLEARTAPAPAPVVTPGGTLRVRVDDQDGAAELHESLASTGELPEVCEESLASTGELPGVCEESLSRARNSRDSDPEKSPGTPRAEQGGTPGPSSSPPTACDERCVGTCATLHNPTAHPKWPSECSGSWRCNGTGPAHRAPKAAPAPAVIVDASQPAGSFAVVSQSGRVEVVNVGAALPTVTREELAAALRKARTLIGWDDGTAAREADELLARYDAEVKP